MDSTGQMQLVDSGHDPSDIRLAAGSDESTESKDVRGTQMEGGRAGATDTEGSSSCTSAPRELPEDLDDLLADIARIANPQLPSPGSDVEFSARQDVERRLKSLTETEIMKLVGIKVPDFNGGKLTVLGHLCVSKSCPKELSELVFSKADVNSLEVFDGHHIPLLHLAAYCGNEGLVELLCEREDLNFYARDSNNFTALHMGVKSGNEAIFTYIYRAAYERIDNVTLIVVISAMLYPLINGKDDLGMTPLHHAAWEGCTNVMKDLFRTDEWYTREEPSISFVDVNATNDFGFTALHLASWHNHLEIVNLLLKHRKIDTTGRSCPRTRIAKTDQGEDLQFKLDRMESHLLQFCGARKDLLYLSSSKKVEEQKEWADENRKRAAQLLFPNSDFNENGKLTALHCAASQGHSNIVAALVKRISIEDRARTTLNALDKHGISTLHHAVMGGDAFMIEELLSNQMVRGNLREQRGNLTPMNMAYVLAKGNHLKGVVVLEEHQVEIVEEYRSIIGLLSEQPDVKAYTESLYRDRQLYVDAANAILVGAALIASITFAGWLQPPLGYQQYYETSFLLTGSAPPDTYASYAAVGLHVSVQIFWICNSLSFFFAIATLVIGACVVLPTVGKSELELDVHRMRKLHVWTTIALSLSVFFVLGAFVAAGFASLPPRLEYQWGMIMTTAIGGFVGLGALTYYLHRVLKLVKLIVKAPKENLGRKVNIQV